MHGAALLCAEESDQSLLKILHLFVLSLEPLWIATMTAFLPSSQPNGRKNHCDAEDFLRGRKTGVFQSHRFALKRLRLKRRDSCAHFAIFWTFPGIFFSS